MIDHDFEEEGSVVLSNEESYTRHNCAAHCHKTNPKLPSSGARWRKITLRFAATRHRDCVDNASVSDDDGHPLTWARVVAAHEWLTRHATCAAATGAPADASGYDSDGDRCPCTWHPVAIEERESHEYVCRTWPGPICGTCWAASCECGFVFDAVGDAHSRWPTGRLRCAGCAP